MILAANGDGYLYGYCFYWAAEYSPTLSSTCGGLTSILAGYVVVLLSICEGMAY